MKSELNELKSIVSELSDVKDTICGLFKFKQDVFTAVGDAIARIQVPFAPPRPLLLRPSATPIV